MHSILILMFVSTAATHISFHICPTRPLIPIISYRTLPLLIECPLISQPIPVSKHTRNLLAIVIRHRVLHARCRRIDAVLADAGEEVFLFLLCRTTLLAEMFHCLHDVKLGFESKIRTYRSHLDNTTPMHHPKQRTPDQRSQQPPNTRRTHCPHTNNHHRIQPKELLA